MSSIRVRRSGLTALAVRIGSVFTGLIFVLLTTLNLSSAEFGLWGLISRTLGYMTTLSIVVTFWATRYRARGSNISRTALLLGCVLSLILAPIFILLSIPIAGSVAAVPQPGNLFFFLISAPEVPLYILLLVLESLILAYAPGEAYGGFAVFEISKVVIGFVAIAVLRLSLTGAIISIIAAQLFQITYLLVLMRHEFSDKISSVFVKSVTRGSWLALLSNLQTWLLNLDYLTIAVFTASTIPLAYFGAATAIASMAGAAAVLSAGLYPYILSGKDPSKATNQVLELELMFIMPAIIGFIALSSQLLHVLNPAYSIASPVVYVLCIANALSPIQGTLESVVTGSDRVDASENVTFSAYAKSKIFLMTKINLALAVAYIASVAAIGVAFGRGVTGNLFGYNGYVGIGILWAFASLAMYAALLILKFAYSRKIAKVAISLRLLGSLAVSSILYFIVLRVLSSVLSPSGTLHGGTVSQLIGILLIALPSLVVYAASMLALSKEARDLARSVIQTVVSP